MGYIHGLELGKDYKVTPNMCHNKAHIVCMECYYIIEDYKHKAYKEEIENLIGSYELNQIRDLKRAVNINKNYVIE